MKVDQLRLLEQSNRTCDKYVQEFKKVARGSGYKEHPLIEEFKRRLNKAVRRRLVEAESLPKIIEEWQERAIKLDHNWRQSRAEEKMFGKEKGEMVRNHPLSRRNEAPPKRQGFFWNQRARDKDPNAIDIDGGARGPIKYYNCGKLDYIAKKC